MEIHADFWPGQRLSKKLCGRRGLYVSFSTDGLHPGSWINRLSVSRESTMWWFMWRRREFYRVIWRCFARVKCGSIMSGFRKCCDCHESHLLCDLSKTLTDKTQVCGWAHVTRIVCAKHKNASWVFSVGDFVLESLFRAQRSADT